MVLRTRENTFRPPYSKEQRTALYDEFHISVFVMIFILHIFSKTIFTVHTKSFCSWKMSVCIWTEIPCATTIFPPKKIIIKKLCKKQKIMLPVWLVGLTWNILANRPTNSAEQDPNRPNALMSQTDQEHHRSESRSLIHSCTMYAQLGSRAVFNFWLAGLPAVLPWIYLRKEK